MTTDAERGGALIYKQRLATRVTHWAWAICLFFLLLSGLQIFMARPDLYIGHQSGFEFDNAVLTIGSAITDGARRGFVDLFGWRFDTTGWLGAIWVNGTLQPRTFPTWMTIPSYRDLGSGRVVHFFFAWALAATLLVWLVASLANGHLKRDILPGREDLREFGTDVRAHARLEFDRKRDYNVLQKLSYFSILCVALPLMIATGLAMSPGTNALVPWITDVFGGRQTARTIHFITMLALVGFFVVHIVMVLAAGPLNELRSIVTGWYRTDAETE
ncbi:MULTISPECIES: cytochrome b/b6 domain-containing protein [unclassified Aureimonas]|uniref:cytochrome b/b6 domain-containing protein n=1 Tax=unclassified Aureimonas TaxID=2615206 RepID=UPI0006F858C2|nr:MULTISPECIES: cytochrome b/b6 domain-containing protein [unclassified Aureimonas]KQT60253.1 HupC [Aureimonas sp. Leaf427]KQT79127.1 HupC [Aureimonas sp. Leaf460]